MESTLDSKLGAPCNPADRTATRQMRLCSALIALLCSLVIICSSTASLADEGGVSFWLPGLFGSLAAAPQQPGWSLMTTYYHTTVSGGGDIGLSREFEIRTIPAGASATLNGGVRSTADLGLLDPTYTFATPLFGGQATLGLLAIYGNVNTNLNGALSGTVTVPGFGAAPFTRTDSLSDAVTDFGDLYPQFFLRWNAGVNNYMTYITGDIPVGAYNSAQLSNVGIGHGAVDSGAGYTYFDPKTGHEFSFVTGLTYNFTNTETDYRNGIDWHLDWGASQFLTKQLQVGLVGYFYDQLTADSGCLPALCPFKSQVTGIGPQIGYIFPVGTMQGYVNVKAYGEFDGHDRPDGWNAWLTFLLSPAPPSAQASPPPMLTKTVPHG